MQGIGEQEEIFKDKNRVQPYIEAITRNKHLFKGKTVLDLHSGLGLFTILASKVGASHIYAYKANENLKTILEDNKITNVTIFEKDIQSQELPIEKVDIIISQWMGNILLYGSQIKELIYARDKYLINNGLIFPDQGRLYIQSIEDGRYKEQKMNFWDNVYGVNMKCMKQWIKKEPLLESLKEEQLNSDPCLIYQLDLYTCTLEDLSFSNLYKIQLLKQDFLTGFILWFDYTFTKCHLPITVQMGATKSPFWKPAIFYLNDEIPVRKGEFIQGSIAIQFESEDILNIKLSTHSKEENMIQYFRLN